MGTDARRGRSDASCVDFSRHKNAPPRQIDMFNALNQAIATSRNRQMQLTSPTDPITAVNLPYDASGALRPNFSLPKNAGFGVATGYQAPRSLQAQIRFSV